MRQSICGEIRTSVLGFGCGSVLGRVGRRASLRAMHAAWDAGITLFDTARSYGFGEAESVLGEFLRGKREHAVVATKYGIPPATQSTLKRIAVPLARAAFQVPGVRGLARRGGEREVQFGQFSVAGLRESLEESLRRLGTDRIDILFLHEATASVMHQQDLMAELESLVRAGKVLRAGLYAGADVIAAGIADGPTQLSAMQFGADPFSTVVAGFADLDKRGTLMIANHPFGNEQRVTRVKTTLAAMAGDASVPAELREKLRANDWPMLNEAILGMALNGSEKNRAGETGSGPHALVFSMMREDHIRANVQAIEACRFSSSELALMRARLLNAPAAVSNA